MPYEPSFGTLEISAPGVARPEPGTPFAIAIFAPLSGNVADFADTEQLTQRKSLLVEFDNLEEKFAELEPRLRLTVAGGGAVVELEFESLDDFHVDEIYRKIYHFEDLLDLAGKIAGGGSEATAEKIRAAAGSPAGDPPVDIATCIPAVAELGRFREAAVRDEGSELSFPDLAARLAGPLVGSAEASNDELAAAVRAGAHSLMRQILHHPDFQALESAWRSIYWLLRLAQKSDHARVMLFDVTAAEFAGDLAGADDLKSSAVFQLLNQAAEDRPWSAIVGHYRFDLLGSHADLLGRMGKIGMRFGAPFLSGMHPRVLHEEFKPDDDSAPAWESLRQQPEAAFVGLGVPGFLIRPPYGDSHQPPETFEFEEYSASDPRPYLLAGAGMAFVNVLLRSFLAEGWDFKAGKHLRIDSVPMHVYRDEHDDEVAVTTELRFTSSVSQVASQLGCVPLLAIRGQDAIELAHFRALAEAPRLIAGRWDEASGVAMVEHSRLAPVGSMSSSMASDMEVTSPVATPEPAVSTEPPEDGDDSAGETDEPAASDEMDPELAALLGDSGADAAADDADDEMDPELAALLAGDDSAPATDEMDPELAALLGESSDESPPADDAMDPELAALLGDSGNPDATDGMDPELAALLAGGDEPEESAGEDEMDPELAALLAGTEETPAEEPAADEPPADELEMDPELAALLAGSETEEEAAGEETPEMDPELAALLGGTEDPPAEPEPEMDPELAALLGAAEAAVEEPPADEAEDAGELDPELAALLGDVEEPEAPAMDPELAALLGMDEPATEAPAEGPQPPADTTEEPASEGLDPELAALLGADDSAAPASDVGETAVATEAEPQPAMEPEPAPEPAPVAAAETEPVTPPGTESEAMSTDIESESIDSEPESEAAAENETAAETTGETSIAEQVAQLREAAPWPEQSSPAVLEFEQLLEPIPGDSPAGSSLAYDVREKLDEYRKEINPDDYADDDPTRPPDYVPANWPGIIEMAQQTLKEGSKDLLVAARLTEALMNQHKFCGLRDGLHLMRLMLEVCWDRMVPEMEDEDDLDLRAGPFEWMDDPDRGARMPNTVKNIPVIPGSQISYSDWAQAQTGDGDVSMADFEKALVDANYSDCAKVEADILQCTAELLSLDKTLDAKLAHLSPGFGALRPALTECYTLAKQILDRKTPEEEEEAGVDDDGQPVASGGGGGGGARGESREDLYRQLTAVADKLQRLEPHSPIPYLVRRAVDLGSKPFPDLLRSLVRDSSIVTELSREFGIPNEDGSSPAAEDDMSEFR